MKTRMISLVTSTVIAAGALFPAMASGELPRYQVVEIGTLADDRTVGRALNSTGQVTGSSAVPWDWSFQGAELDTKETSFLWDGQSMHDLDQGVLNPDHTAFLWTTGLSINDSGMVVGQYEKTYECEGMFFWDGYVLTALEISLCVEPAGINSSGLMLGKACPVGCRFGYSQPVVWDGANFQYIFDSSTLPYGPYSIFAGSLALNDRGQVSGHVTIYETMNADSFGFVWAEASGLQRLEFYPTDINSLGNIVGYKHVDSSTQAVFWDASSLQTIDLQPLDMPLLLSDSNHVFGYSAGFPVIWHAGELLELQHDASTFIGKKLNASGQLVGTYGDHPVYRAFVWDGVAVVNLNDVISKSWPQNVVLLHARDINDSGQILASGMPPGGGWRTERAYVLTPIPLLIEQLRSNVFGIGPGRKIQSSVDSASRHYEAGNLRQTCSQLDRVAANLVAYDAADAIVNSVYDIRIAIDCP